MLGTRLPLRDSFNMAFSAASVVTVYLQTAYAVYCRGGVSFHVPVSDVLSYTCMYHCMSK